MTEEEYIEKLADSVAEALDADWTDNGMGQIEETQATQQLIIECISVTIALLINNNALDINQLKSTLTEGWRIKKVQP